ncbi:MAG: hypothetical protein GY929_18000 [Actinomycetia bacterium]|nr:hypothetical protein [Actinomycetes bacterium]
MSMRFVVESPFQLLMATEARAQLGAGWDHELVLLWPSAERARRTIEDVLDDSEWSTVVDGGVRSTVGHPGRARLIRSLAREPADHLFIGDYLSPYMRHLALSQRSGVVHLLDDGRGTINTLRLRSDPTGAHPRPDSRRLSKRALIRLLGLRNGRVPALDYFTIFDLDPLAPDTVTPNGLFELKSQVAEAEVVDEHLFLGSAFAERGMMTEDRYVNLLTAIMASSAHPLAYRPHRDEALGKLARLEAASIEVVSGSATVELALARSGRLPAAVSSFFSSASFTLWRLFGDRIDVGSYALTADDFVPGWFATGDGLPALLEQTHGALRVSAVPGRSAEGLERYRHLLPGC